MATLVDGVNCPPVASWRAGWGQSKEAAMTFMSPEVLKDWSSERMGGLRRIIQSLTEGVTYLELDCRS